MAGPRTRTKKTSKGERRSVATKVQRTEAQKIFDKQRARDAGKKVATLMVNPDLKNIRKAPYVRVVY